MQFSLTLRTGIVLALCLHLCIGLVSAQAGTTPAPTGGGKSSNGATMTTVKNAFASSAKSDQPGKLPEATTKPPSNETTSGRSGSWRLESSWVFIAISAVFFITRMSV